MALTKSFMTLTWYPGAVGATADPWVILEVDDDVDFGSAVSIFQSVQVQSAAFVRAEQVDHWNRGGKSAGMEFTRTLKVADPAEAAERVASEVVSLPDVEGWLRIQLSDHAGGFRATEWSIDRCVFASIPGEVSPVDSTLRLRYEFRGGKLAVYTGAVPDEVYTTLFELEDSDGDDYIIQEG